MRVSVIMLLCFPEVCSCLVKGWDFVPICMRGSKSKLFAFASSYANNNPVHRSFFLLKNNLSTSRIIFRRCIHERLEPGGCWQSFPELPHVARWPWFPNLLRKLWPGNTWSLLIKTYCPASLVSVQVSLKFVVMMFPLNCDHTILGVFFRCFLL